MNRDITPSGPDELRVTSTPFEAHAAVTAPQACGLVWRQEHTLGRVELELMTAHQALNSLEMSMFQSVEIPTTAGTRAFEESLRRYTKTYFADHSPIETTICGLKSLFIEAPDQFHYHALVQYRGPSGRYLVPRDDGAVSEFNAPVALRISVKLRPNERNSVLPYQTESKPLLSPSAFQEGLQQVRAIDRETFAPCGFSALPLFAAEALQKSALRPAPNDDLVVESLSGTGECRLKLQTSERTVMCYGKLHGRYNFVQWKCVSF